MNLISFASIHISIKAEEIFQVAGISITNSHLLGAIGLIVLLALLFNARAVAIGKKSANFASKLILWAYSSLYGTVMQVIPDKKWAKKVAPLSISLFLFIIAQYWMGLLPIVGSITIGEHHTPLFRGMVADLNMTLALAAVTIVAAQVYAIKYLGFRGNLGRYFYNPLKDPIMTFVGLLELIAEFSRLLGLSFRLFGNVLTGEVLLVVIASLTQYFTPVAIQPFYIFELFIGGIQAYIFFMLATVFISLGLDHHDESDSQVHSPAVNNKMKAEHET